MRGQMRYRLWRGAAVKCLVVKENGMSRKLTFSARFQYLGIYISKIVVILPFRGYSSNTFQE